MNLPSLTKGDCGHQPFKNSSESKMKSMDMEGMSFDNATYVWGKHSHIGPFTGEVKPGQWLGLIGPNGAGKSTFLRMISGALPPTTGRIYLDGEDLYGLSARQRARRIAVVPQTQAANLNLKVREVVELGRLPHLGFSERFETFPEEHWRYIKEALSATDTLKLAERRFSTLSGGEKQLVMLAMALAQGGSVLVLDEPTAHLDPGHSHRFLDSLSRLVEEKSKTVVMAYHDLALASRYCTELWIFYEGTVVRQGPPDHVLDTTFLEGIYGTRFLSWYHPATGSRIVLPD